MTRAAKELDILSSSEPRDLEPHEQDRAEQLAARIAAVRAEARRDPEGYLEDTVVPEGGE
ncbi:hypothetical protein [Paraliomyxa miuraensis]|uniref:hypothetical protein n=1 Tax=Paraliomyxa miuraensis TaxID=376150 RepID=UPI002254C43D|nr:hypothetical protein [Paraliomyxa miuraensis]MCX4240889.1 hypothetical protein [Paraliomyxa miuraensis]